MRLLILSLLCISSQLFANIDDYSDEYLFSLDSSVQIIFSDINSSNVDSSLNAERGYVTKLSHSEKKDNRGGIISLPLPNASEVQLKVEETQVMSVVLAKKFPSIKTYKVSGLHEKGLVGRVDISPQGLHAVLQTADGRRFVINPIQRVDNSYAHYANDSKRYKSSWVKAHKAESSDGATCGLTDELGIELTSTFSAIAPIKTYLEDVQLQQKASLVQANIYVYRIAISATASYVHAQGGTKAAAMAAIARTINRNNQVYERDAGIRLQLVDNNDQLVFLSNDPFSGSLTNILSQNQELIDRVIGTENYDVGHVFTTRRGGLAFVGSACQSNLKAMGVSGNVSVGSERFALEFVAHEIAHQFSATHTFNSNQGLCSDSHRNQLSAYEPGSGTTIMAYIGICGSDNLQSHADAMFHVGSIAQIMRHKQIQQAKGCGTLVTTLNKPPVVNAGRDYSIPANTPFVLEGSATDPDGDVLLFNWEQQDAGLASPVNVDTGNNALFRTYLPTTSQQRTLPRLQKILGFESSKGELLPNRNRLMHFKFVAHDSKGATVSDAMTVNVVADRAVFRLHTPPLFYTKDEEALITWEVANTNIPPISCSSVNIGLSTDNGLHFNELLATNVPNTGAIKLVLPDTVTQRRVARLKLSCSDNIFFSISSRPFGTARQGTEIPDSGDVIVENIVDDGTNVNNEGAAGSFNTYWLMFLGLLFFSSFFNVKLRKACWHKA